MNTNKLIRFCCLVFIAALFADCSKLEEKTFSQNTTENFFGSLKDVQAALTGMYRPMQVCCGGYEQSGHFLLNVTADEAAGVAFWGDYDNLTYTASSTGEIPDWWNSSYKAIAGANLITDNQAKIEAADNTTGKVVAKAAIAEAKFWRALNYFQLVQMFGGVPLRLTQTKRADEVNIPRNTVDEVYAQVIKDFKDAETGLPASPGSAKVSKWAASSFLAKVYLTKKDFPNALAKATDVIANGPYTLAAKFADVFDIAKKNGTEDIFAIQYLRVDGQGNRLDPLTGAWGLSNYEANVYPKFSATDDRKNTTFRAPTNPASNQGKWLDPQAVSADGAGGNFIVFRYADLILIKAEAENEVNGPTAVAYTEINKIRTRALITSLTAGLTKDQFRDAVLKERNLELAMEEVRWFDLKRTDRLKSTLIATGRTWNDKYYLFPLPQAEIDASNGVLKQNPGF
jgi:starch-binding outer membrane protein, SusD/RagB family